MSSGWPPPPVGEDSQNRSSKKVRTRDGEERMVTPTEGVSPKSYRDSLLKMKGASATEGPDFSEMWDDDVAENKWYQEVSDDEPVNPEFDPCPVIPVSQEEYQKWCSDWALSLVVHVLGKRVSIRVLESRLRSFWVKDGDIQIIDLPQDYYLVHFSAETDYLHALYEGPWLVANHYLIVQRWRPFFMRSVKTVRKIAAWVRIPDLPIELYNEKFLWRIGAKLGTMLKVDRLTSIQSRGKFARICVEIDLERKLTSKIQVLGQVLSVEYEGLNLVCFGCGKYGHRKDHCPEYKVDNIPESQAEVVKEGSKEGEQPADMNMEEGPENPSGTKVVSYDKDKGVITDSDFGPWMLVKRPMRKRGTQNERGKKETRSRGSRFQILEEPGEQGDQKGKGKSGAVLQPINQEKRPDNKDGGLGAKKGERASHVMPSGKENNNGDATMSDVNPLVGKVSKGDQVAVPVGPLQGEASAKAAVGAKVVQARVNQGEQMPATGPSSARPPGVGVSAEKGDVKGMDVDGCVKSGVGQGYSGPTKQ